MNLPQLNENIIQISKSGQLTIPAKLRELFPWLNQDRLVEAKPTAGGLLLHPVNENKLNRVKEKKISVSKLLKRLARLAKHDQGSGMSTVEFLRLDRQSH